MLKRLGKTLLQDVLYLFNKRYLNSTLFLTRISLKRQYRESFLGILWTLIQPTIHITVLSFVFSFLLRTPVENYSLYVMGGILPWTLLTTTFTGGANGLIGKAGLIKGGCILPKTMFIISDVLVNIYVFFISFITMYAVIGIFFAHISPMVLLWPIVVLPLIGTCICAAIAFAYLAPFVKDISHLITILMNALFWTIPIAYPIAMIPPENHIYFQINPFYMLIEPIQTLVHKGVFPGVVSLAKATTVMMCVAFTAWIVHKRFKRDVVYYL